MGNLLAACKFDEDAAPARAGGAQAAAPTAAAQTQTRAAEAGAGGAEAESGGQGGLRAEPGTAASVEPERVGERVDDADEAQQQQLEQDETGADAGAATSDGIPLAENIEHAELGSQHGELAIADVNAEAEPDASAVVKADAAGSDAEEMKQKQAKGKDALNPDEIQSVASTASSSRPRRSPSRKAGEVAKSASRTVKRVFTRKSKKTPAS
ncbi:Hypothetical Protein FCC1311_007362 [Hondaea fermentalgiana]|uniref:Uncharacterized protein n=1 Tax=Hondaea fermentalgiana TaxID=2315210 RepID=A0A2R5G0G3_9STRA|nr:Hypothetical Protein FCC1311_007362 [Hondaea fermentalgiana]|eukprot:GBG24517.1 Hypothetical Protein FCC1311_007362 [Hondaea fermentalgiana]